jgi:ABC-type antimicrobial peptide transport system permease subunit
MGRKPQKNDSLPGSLDMLILRTLSLRDLHGYGIVQFIQQSSDNELLVEEGSLYPALQRLELNGWIEGVWGVTPNNMNVVTQAAEIDRTISRELMFAKLCTGFAVLALLMACVGLYGTMSYNVARQVGEIGIRMALGAQRGAVVWMVLRGVLLLAAVGLAISVPAALIASHLLKSFLFQVEPNHPGTLALAGVVLLSAALVAGYVPAWRASRIDPLAALRQD